MKVWPVLENELKWRKPCHKSTSPQVALESDLLLHSLENSELPSSEEEVKQSSHISRPVEHHGAKLREETRERGRYTKAKLLMDCGLNPEYLHHSPAVQKVTKKAQEFRAETLWGDIIKYQSLDVLKFGKRSGLTHDHLYPTGKLKMRVKFAAQTMSYSVASAMCSIVVASEGRHLSDSLQTAKFIHDVDLLFDICNGPGPKDKVKSQRCNVAEGSIHHALWRKLYASMKNWKFLKKVTNKKGEVSIKETVPPCVTGWMDNIKGFQRLWTICKSLGFSELNLRRLNSDPVENLYSIVRQTNGANRNPTCIQFESSLKTALVNGMSHFKIKGKNCSDDDSVLLSTEEALFGGSRASEASNLYIPENRTIMVRGKPEYLQSVILNDKCTRLAPAVQCNIVVSKVLKEEDFKDCLTCKNALVATNPSSDHILSANLNNNLNCFENEESVNYAEALKCTSENLKNPQNNFSSPELLHNFIICQKKFLTDCSSFLYLNNCSDLTKELISTTFEDFDWLCSEHQGSLKLKLVSCIAECFLNQLCRSINKYLRDSIKRKNLLSKLKAKKVAVVLKNNQVSDSDPDWVDMSEEEAASLINFLLDKNDLQQTGAVTPVTPVTPKRTCSEQLAGPTPKRQKVVSCLKDVTSTPLPPLLTPQRIPHVTPARVQVHTSTRTDCTPYSGASATPARLKVMASWSGRPFPSTPQPPQPPLPPQPMPPETPIKKLTVDFLRAFLKVL
ncbi:hypothetical protein FOCC_FOCC014030 [Frankliniella occidentalis]|nr:hypothetical protein FOCC_FOCC014030 [Frankliniella occidentalis]